MACPLANQKGKILSLSHKKWKIDTTISFIDDDYERVETPHNDLLTLLTHIDR